MIAHRKNGTLSRLQPYQDLMYVERSTLTGCNILISYNEQTKDFFGYCTETKTFRLFKLLDARPYSSETIHTQIVTDVREVSFEQDLRINCVGEGQKFRPRIQIF